MLTTNSPLTEHDLRILEDESWIDAATVDAFGLSRVSSEEGAALVGRPNTEDYTGVIFPCFWPGESSPTPPS